MPYELLDEQPPSTGLSEKKGLPQKALEYGASALGQTAARGFETIAGTPGNLLGLAPNLVSFATGGRTPSYSQIREKVPFLPPQSSELRQKTQEHTGELLEPQSEPAKLANEAVEFFSDYYNPLNWGNKVNKVRAIATSIGAPVAGWLAKETFGGSDAAGAIAKTLVSLGGNFAFRNKEINQLMETSYDTFRNAPITKPTSTKKLSQDLAGLYKRVKEGDTVDKEFLLKRINAAEDLVHSGSFNHAKALDRRINLNDQLKSANLNKKGYKDLDELTGYFREYLAQVAKENPDAGKFLTGGDEIYKATQEAGRVTRFLSKVLPKQQLAQELVKHGIVWGPGSIVGFAAGGAKAAALGAPVKGAYDIYKFMQTSIGRKLYGQLLKQGFAGNANAVNRIATHMEKQYKKMEKQEQSDKYQLLED